MVRSKEDEIFDAAVKVFKEKGYHAASMQDVANAVGLQKGSLYHYISGKEDLLFRMCQRAISTFNDRIEQIMQMDLSPTEKLRRALVSHVVTVTEKLELISVFLHEGRALGPVEQASISAERDRYERLIQRLLEEGIQAGEFRPVDVKMVSYALLGMCNWVYQWYSADGRLSPHEVAAIFVDLALRGLAERGW